MRKRVDFSICGINWLRVPLFAFRNDDESDIGAVERSICQRNNVRVGASRLDNWNKWRRCYQVTFIDRSGSVQASTWIWVQNKGDAT